MRACRGRRAGPGAAPAPTCPDSVWGPRRAGCRFPALLVPAVGVRGLDLLGELLELVREGGAEALELGDLVAVLGQAELGGELLLVQEVFLGPLGRLHR